MNSLDKNFLLQDSKTFCMMPFMHLHTSPDGNAYPCCRAADKPSFGNTNTNTIKEIINSKDMSALRGDMVSEVPNSTCTICYNHESANIRSGRQYSNEEFSKYFESNVAETLQADGSLSEFKMRFFDIRFSNICNMKCRTCGPEFSSQWEMEYKKHRLAKYIIINDNKQAALLEEIKTHIPHMDTAYFAGGEPLITEEHYILIEDMIRQGRTDIKLRYNTNISNLKFKDKDILSLWNKFDRVEISASIDHFGPRAEYIRHGTKWDDVLANLKKLRLQKSPRFDVSINTVVSIFNYMTIDTFYYYLIENELLCPDDSTYSLYNMSSPNEYTATALPLKFKDIARPRLQLLHDRLSATGFGPDQLLHVKNMIKWVDGDHTWESNKETFRAEVLATDKIRGEDFVKTFPELASLLED